MASTVSRCLLLFLCAVGVKAYDDIDFVLSNVAMTKLLRALENQTKADTLNLPANSTSIRENITDTFSCENRTYGYYADVDNECQVFHVCLPSQTPSGRNVTYRWSFICPNETVFNQEYLVCTRPRDAIDCEEAPSFYDVNLEIGKVTNETNEQTQSEASNTENEPNNNTNEPNKEAESIRIRNQIRKQNNHKKQNLIVETLLKASHELKADAFYPNTFGESEKENLQAVGDQINLPLHNADEVVPVVIDDVSKYQPQVEEYTGETAMQYEMENSRLAAERSLKRKGRKIYRGSFKFKSDTL